MSLIDALTGRPAAKGAPLSPCKGCPWRTENHGRPHPDGWYTKTNIKRLWSGLRTGEAPGMSCHPTDPNNPVSEKAQGAGYKEAPEHSEVRECAGSVILQMREVDLFQRADGDFTAYRRGRAGAMTKVAMFNFAMRMAVRFPGEVPINMNHDLNEPVSVPGQVPWDNPTEEPS